MDPYTRALLMAAPSLVKAGQSLFSKTPQRKVSSDTTALLNKQRQIAKDGLYGENVKNDIATDIKQSQKESNQNIRNLAIQQGLESSGIPAEQMLKQGGKTTLELARMAKEIALANEESKINALKSAAEISQGISDIDYNNALARMQRRDNIIGSFGDALSTGVSAYGSQKRQNELDDFLFGTNSNESSRDAFLDWVAKNRDKLNEGDEG
jgi:hypothetical protein